MTSEVIIKNREAIAMAADSAVTVTSNGKYDKKIFPTANKLFTLSKYHPIGIMFYGNAHLMGVPWEVIIKQYRKELGEKSFSKLKYYAEDFVNFLNTNKILFPDSIQTQYFKNSVEIYMNFLKENIFDELNTASKGGKSLGKRQRKEIIYKAIEKDYNLWSNEAQDVPSMPKKFGEELWVKYESVIERATATYFGEYSLKKEYLKKLKQIMIEVIPKL